MSPIAAQHAAYPSGSMATKRSRQDATTSGLSAAKAGVNQRASTASAMAAMPCERTVRARSSQLSGVPSCAAVAIRNEALRPLCMPDSERLRRHASERQADDMRLVDAERVEEPGMVVGKVIDAGVAPDPGRAAVPAYVVGQAAVAPRERPQLCLPHLGGRANRVRERHHYAVLGPSELVTQRHAIRPPRHKELTAAAARSVRRRRLPRRRAPEQARLD
jgi:hypothetical protein